VEMMKKIRFLKTVSRILKIFLMILTIPTGVLVFLQVTVKGLDLFVPIRVVLVIISISFGIFLYVTYRYNWLEERIYLAIHKEEVDIDDYVDQNKLWEGKFPLLASVVGYFWNIHLFWIGIICLFFIFILPTFAIPKKKKNVL